MDAQGHLMPVNDAFHIYDTTLRDGAQQEGLNLSHTAFINSFA